MTSMPSTERLGTFLKRAEQAMIAAKTAALKPAGLTVPQFSALMYLAENPGISAAALARLAGVTPPTMNTVLTNLQERGLVERSPHEWHKNVLETRLTESGKELTAAADARAIAVERAVGDRFTADEFATLTALLARTAQAFEEVRQDLP
ncbi:MULTISPECIES: MarR family winged helix-turn-helix transcriptional regulator [Nocardia]|uniref:DNA-binding MarR family transcriptional regulator n=1 Tax=Nocardia neocaledoniensis TaxID=236511 RepID=A0A317NEG3_9NOCA|nr:MULTISPECIES: MarR family transcriptional regulator [Nocardia]PWV73492.1 DNA-binding MarR family transcriptional regulator [Nocardia neocaledoniensis]UGT58140.1 MarR family transcriptional regulator [Nocardia asteroides]